ncbi:MAG TPA: hypothetical protein VK171_15250, partial [Fimbriimonas sp.]|nr:hypothetical protein [Fimbriimonas sp.]
VRLLWFGFAATGGGAFVASVFFLVAPTPVTLAQVIEADAKTKSVTIINRRIMGPEKGGGFTITRKILGDIVKTSVSRMTHDDVGNFDYSDSKQSVRYMPSLNVAILDGPSRYHALNAKPPSLAQSLRNMRVSHVETDFDWNGKKVTRFTFKGMVRDSFIEDELIADPNTKLPIQFTRMRENRAWGDVYEYDYSKIDPLEMTPIVPDGTQMIDHRLVRKELESVVPRKETIGLAVLASPVEAAVLIDRKLLPKTGPFTFGLKVGSQTTPITSQMDLRTSGNLLIGSREYGLVIIRGMNPDWFGLRTLKVASGDLTISRDADQKSYRFNAIPVFLSGDIENLMQPFSGRFRMRKK